MPYIEGEALRHRMSREGELPIAEVVRSLKEIGAALGYAHRHRIVHRDIKPENILFSDGNAVVADFGIAKAVFLSRTDGDAKPNTITSMGVALGTPMYMAPEQAVGDASLDHRADLYSVGCVAYEMLTGRPPFDERTPQQIMAAHATVTPEPIGVRRTNVPPMLASLVMQCLEKRPADRPQTAEAFVRALEAISFISKPTATLTAAVPAAQHYRAPFAVFLGVAIASAVAGALFHSTISPARSTATAAAPSRNYSILLPDTAPMAFIGSSVLGAAQRALALSPDGLTLAYIAAVRGTTMLYLLRLDGEGRAFIPVPGSEGAYSPIFSPDSKSVGFLAGTRLYTASASGGRPTALTVVAEPYNAAWLPNKQIVVSTVGGAKFDFVEEASGRTRRMRGAGTYGLSPASIGSRWLVAYPNREISFYETGDSARRAVLTTDGKTTIRSSDLVDYSTVVGGLPTFVGTHLVFARAAEEGTLMAIPFDSTRMEALGEPKPVRQGIRIEGGGYGVAQYAVSDDGTLIYAAGTNELLMQLVTRDRRGDTATLPFPKLDVSAINVSWDGRFMAARLWSPGVPPKWVRLDLDNGRQTPLPDSLLISAIMDADGESVLANKLAPDGRRVTLRFRRAGANPDTVVRDGAVIAVSRSGHMFLVVGQRGRPETWAVWRDSVGHPPQRMGGTALASLSPSGDWAAITIEIAGKSQVRIVRTARPADYYDLTTSGGEEPRWSADEREIIYRSLNSWYSVAMPSRAGDAPGKPVPLFTGYYSNMPGYSHGLLPDGRHLLFRGSSVQTTGRLEVVTNWLSEVRRIAPVARR